MSGWTTELVLHYASAKEGLSGEAKFDWPDSYLQTHVVEEDGWKKMDADKARVVRRLLDAGALERREKIIHVPADTTRTSMFYGTPAHVLHSFTYHLTPQGRQKWLAGAREAEDDPAPTCHHCKEPIEGQPTTFHTPEKPDVHYHPRHAKHHPRS